MKTININQTWKRGYVLVPQTKKMGPAITIEWLVPCRECGELQNLFGKTFFTPHTCTKCGNLMEEDKVFFFQGEEIENNKLSNTQYKRVVGRGGYKLTNRKVKDEDREKYGLPPIGSLVEELKAIEEPIQEPVTQKPITGPVIEVIPVMEEEGKPVEKPKKWKPGVSLWTKCWMNTALIGCKIANVIEEGFNEGRNSK